MYYKKKRHNFWGNIINNKMTKLYLLIILIFILLIGTLFQFLLESRKEGKNKSEIETESSTVPSSQSSEEPSTSYTVPTLNNKDIYKLKINKATNILYVYKIVGEAEELQNAMLCSVAENIQETTVKIASERYMWKQTQNETYCQYSTLIGNSYYLQSIPYFSTNKDTLNVDYYYNLGQETLDNNTIYLHTGDAQWIYNNLGADTEVEIYSNPNEIATMKPDELINILWIIRWEPTDPDSKNVFYTGHVGYYEGITNKTIKVGDYFNPLSDVRCINSDGNIIPEGHILVDGVVDTQTPGEYYITYVIEDIYGDNIVWDCMITVEN